MLSFERCLQRYRFYEALALYDLYYDRLNAAMRRVSELPEVLSEDRPLTWVPLVFHGTSLRSLEGILNDGCIKPSGTKTYVSLTELQIDELDRLRSLGPRVSEVAIGFPRALLETRGLFQPAYLRHAAPEIKAAINAPPGYVELDDDLGAMHEVRVPERLEFGDAVWILSSVRNPETRELDNPLLKRCQEQYGIALSYWHPTHQREMIQEHVYRKIVRNAQGQLESVKSRGAFYALKDSESVEKEVILPAGKSFHLRFPTTASLRDWEGPFTKIEMAMFFYQELRALYPERMAEVRERIRFG